jgi:hypothetical protein
MRSITTIRFGTAGIVTPRKSTETVGTLGVVPTQLHVPEEKEDETTELRGHDGNSRPSTDVMTRHKRGLYFKYNRRLLSKPQRG